MIEQYPFRINDYSFFELPFQEKFRRYSTYIETLRLTYNIYLDDPSWNLFNGVEAEDTIILQKKLDKTFDFFKNFENYVSMVESLSKFEYKFLSILPQAWDKAKDLFYLNKISPLELTSVIDNRLLQFDEDLQNADEQDILAISDIFYNDIKIILEEISIEIKYLYDYISLINKGGALLNASWGSVKREKILEQLTEDYARIMTSFNILQQKDIGNSIQLSLSLSNQMLNDTSNNLEMVLSKSTKISFENANIREQLEIIENNL